MAPRCQQAACLIGNFAVPLRSVLLINSPKKGRGTQWPLVQTRVYGVCLMTTPRCHVWVLFRADLLSCRSFGTTAVPAIPSIRPRLHVTLGKYGAKYQLDSFSCKLFENRERCPPPAGWDEVKPRGPEYVEFYLFVLKGLHLSDLVWFVFGWTCACLCAESFRRRLAIVVCCGLGVAK